MLGSVEPVEAAAAEPAGQQQLGVLDRELIVRLTDPARPEGLKLTGKGGLLQHLRKLVLEAASEGEMDDHLGCARHDRAGAGSGNSRNGRRAKTPATEVGPVRVEVPRDREGTFEPQIVREWQRRLLAI
ncbi:transposase [Streptomyces sp. NPDC050564]|uniref:transposase n=1 Tax=Streptomyces sp. NPDC050564 TaxID=3365631 RepID=UPI0037881032